MIRPPPHPSRYQPLLGITLIEALIGLVVIGLLAALAMPAYTAHVQRSHRAEARFTLLALAQRLEQNHTLSGSYHLHQDGRKTVDAAFIRDAGFETVPVSGTARYKIGFSQSPTAQPTATSFVIEAIPTGAQASDRCGTLLLNHQNLRGAGGVLDNRATLTLECWSR